MPTANANKGQRAVVSEAPTAVLAPPPIEAKAAACSACNARFVPEGDADVCADCKVKAEARRARAKNGRTRCRVAGPGLVSAEGWVDGRVRYSFGPGEVAEFADADVLSLPHALIPEG